MAKIGQNVDFLLNPVGFGFLGGLKNAQKDEKIIIFWSKRPIFRGHRGGIYVFLRSKKGQKRVKK